MAGFPATPRGSSLDFVIDKINQLLRGKLNVTLDVTLTANSATTTVTDERISVFSFIGWEPLTAHAAAEIAAGGMYVDKTTQVNGALTITHANNAQTDRTFRIAILS